MRKNERGRMGSALSHQGRLLWFPIIGTITMWIEQKAHVEVSGGVEDLLSNMHEFMIDARIMERHQKSK